MELAWGVFGKVEVQLQRCRGVTNMPAYPFFDLRLYTHNLSKKASGVKRLMEQNSQWSKTTN